MVNINLSKSFHTLLIINYLTDKQSLLYLIKAQKNVWVYYKHKSKLLFFNLIEIYNYRMKEKNSFKTGFKSERQILFTEEFNDIQSPLSCEMTILLEYFKL